MKDSQKFIELFPKFGNDSRLSKDELGAIALVYDLTDGLKDFDANLFAEPELKFEYELALKAMFRLAGVEEKPKEETKPKAEKTEKPQAEKKEKVESEKTTKPQKQKKEIEQFKGKLVRKESEEHKFVKAFLAVRKHPEMNLIVNAYIKLNKAVVEGSLKKDGVSNPELFYAMQKSYYDVIQRKANSLELTKELLAEAEQVAASEKKYDTVKYMSEYTGWTGKEKTEKQVELFVKKVGNALKSAKSTDPYFEELTKIKDTLAKASVGQTIMPTSVGLAGIPRGFKIVK